MALLDIFKKRRKKSFVRTQEAPKPSDSIESPRQSRDKKGGAIIYDIVKEPHISEKGSVLAEKGQYVFKVFPNANKTEIKKAIEGIYGVDVLSVNIITIPAKKRRLGKISGFKKGYKKAIVKIKPGQKIEIL